MKKGFFTPRVIFVSLVYILIVVTLYVGIPQYFELPRWSTFSIFIFGISFVREITSFFNPERSGEWLSFFGNTNRKDQILFFVSLAGTVVLNMLEGFFFNQINDWFGFLVVIGDLVVFALFINLFASPQFKQRLNQKLQLW